MEWIEIDKNSLPENEVLAANFKKGSFGYKDKWIGYLRLEGAMVVCDFNDDILEDCTHYIDIDQHDIN